MSEKIFISYSRKDEDIVLPFKDEIEQQTYKGSCWIDVEGINSLQYFTDVIIDAINRTEIFLFMFSANSLKSEWTRNEINFAKKKDKKIIIVFVDDSEFDDWFSFNFDLKQHSFLSKPESRARLLSDLKTFVSSDNGSQNGSIFSHLGSTIQTVSNDETIIVSGVSFKMIYVEGGTFMMGSFEENPIHEVTLDAYHIGETEVTQELWKTVMGSNPSNFKGSQNPVERVSWNDCQEFITKLNSLTVKQFRLPTEAEWEFAARGGNKSQGYKYSGSNDVNEVAWYRRNSGGIFSSHKTHAVKTKSANELGIYDMTGNVWEWCNDWFGAYPSSSVTNPTGVSSASFRVNRGGCWFSDASYCRVSYRLRLGPTRRDSNLGLRLAF